MSAGTGAPGRARRRVALGRLRDDEREFAPALRAIARAQRLAPQLRLLARVHSLLGAGAIGLALLATVLLGGAFAFATDRPGWALAAGGALVAGLAGMGVPWLALGFGLRRRRAWARALGITCAVVLLPFVPLGTLLGAWTLTILLAWQPHATLAVGAD